MIRSPTSQSNITPSFVEGLRIHPTSLAALCRLSIPYCTVYIIKNDDFSVSELLPHLDIFSAIIVGPGPGSPENPHDIGIVKDLWKLQDKHLIPIFGVCLGLQSLAIGFGAKLDRLHIVKHGQVSRICHAGIDLFEDVGTVEAVRYHSLHVELAIEGEIEMLAWADDGVENGRIVMAVKHRTRPFWAVQYHPESVCTKGGGSEVIRNFWRLAQNWARKNGRSTRPWDVAAKRTIGLPWPHVHPHSPPPSPSRSSPSVITTVLSLPDLTVTTICELFGASDEPSLFVLLDSASQPGRFSIVGSLVPSSLHITYFVQDAFVRLTKGNSSVHEVLRSRDIWSWLATFMRGRKARGGQPEIPFWGGLVGQLNYELGIHSLHIPLKQPNHRKNNPHPDVNLVFVERSVVLDNVTGKVYVQSLIPDDDDWIADTATKLIKTSHKDLGGESYNNSVKKRRTSDSSPIVTLPDKACYISRINQAKDHLFAGDSYELCLTALTHVTLRDAPPSCPSISSSWERYKALRRNNPAPYSAYIRLHPTTLLSSSPERFLSFSRPPGTICQLRPIKGTVRKALGITRAIAEQALASSTKEVAENLMIVDLIRHDLHGVIGEDVQVKQFCGVEEYETVWQLVSVIEGKLSPDTSADLDLDGELGWEVLRRSLPPGNRPFVHSYPRHELTDFPEQTGSMTGAPKKRSVEILQTLEDNDRSVYSGVFGYWCVGGGGDWSVTIRSCFKFDDRYEINSDVWPAKDQYRERPDEWVIGAGGAITALSDAEAEWEEMIVKLQSVLRTFGVSLPEH